MGNTIALVRKVIGDLSTSGFRAAIFGGWAEELLAMTSPRAHNNIDLVVLDPDAARLDAFVESHGAISGKHFSHKRAFLANGVMVELLIVRCRTTLFWDRVPYQWPQAEPAEIDGLPVAPREWLAAYRRDHATIRVRYNG